MIGPNQVFFYKCTINACSESKKNVSEKNKIFFGIWYREIQKEEKVHICYTHLQTQYSCIKTLMTLYLQKYIGLKDLYTVEHSSESEANF